MTVLNFPSNPTDGQTFTENSITYTWNANGANEGFWAASGEAINLQSVTDNGNTTDTGIEFQNTAGNQEIEINADDATGSYTLTLPPTAGTANQVLAIDTVTGTDLELEWANATAAAGDGQININANNGLTASGDNATANQSGNTTRTIGIANNGVTATQLNVAGNGQAGEVLQSDGDGSFSWTANGGGSAVATGTIVSDSLTTAWSGSSGATVSGLSVSVTPATTNERHFVMVMLSGTNGGDGQGARIEANGVTIGEYTGTGTGVSMGGTPAWNNQHGPGSTCFMFLHSPNSTSQQNYTVMVYDGRGGTVRINSSNSTDPAQPGGISTISVIRMAS